MPEPPQVGLITRFVLENPFPLVVVLVTAAAIVGWTGLRGGLVQRLQSAALLLAVAAGLLITDWAVVTSGEHATVLVRRFVDAVVQRDLVAADRCLAEDAAMTVGSPRNPGQPKSFILDQLDRVSRRYTISSNRVTELRGFSQDADRATIHLGCVTEVDGGYGPTATRWVLTARRQSGGGFLIHRLSWMTLQGRPATSGALRGGR